MAFKKRRAVGGLISLIGIILVFGIGSVAYLEISSAQTNLISTSLETNQKISDKNNARINFTNISTSGGGYDLTLENLGNDIVIIHSYIVSNSTHDVIGTGEINTSIKVVNTDIVSTGVLNEPPNSSDIILIVTDLGKKCIIPASVNYRIC